MYAQMEKVDCRVNVKAVFYMPRRFLVNSLNDEGEEEWEPLTSFN